MNWTSEADALLRQWTANGDRAREMADRLGCTRNAVLGRRHRLGITCDGLTPREPTPRAAKAPRPPGAAQPRSLAWTPERRAKQSALTRQMIAEGRFVHAKSRDVVLETFARVYAGMSRYKAAASMGVSHQNLRPGHWPAKYPDLVEKAKALGAARRAQIAAWEEAKKEAERQQRDAQLKACADANARVLPHMPERIQQIVHRRVAGETLEEVAETLAITRERVRQLQAWAITRGAIIPGVRLSPAMMEAFGPRPPRRSRARSRYVKKGWSEDARAAASARMKAAWDYVRRMEAGQ